MDERHGLVVRRLPVVALVGAIATIATATLAPVVHATDEMIFRGALERMHRGQGFYPAMKAALASQDAAASQVRSFRLPTQFLLLRPFPVSSYRWLAAAVVLASVLLCWRLARRAHPAVQAGVLLASALWLTSLLGATYLYAEIWALPCFLLGLVAVRDRRWAWAAVAFAVATCLRELYLPALLVAAAVAPRGRRKPFAVAVGVVAAVGLAHHGLASEQLVAQGAEAPFNRFAELGTSLRFIVTPRPRLGVALPLVPATVLGAVGIARSWRHDPAARVAGWTSLALVGATLFGGRPYWPLLFSPALVAFAGAALDPRLALRDHPDDDGAGAADDDRAAGDAGTEGAGVGDRVPAATP